MHQRSVVPLRAGGSCRWIATRPGQVERHARLGAVRHAALLRGARRPGRPVSRKPLALDLHLMLDNSSTQKTALVRHWLAKHPHVLLHFTRTSASWLNVVECWFSLLTARQLQRGTFRSTHALE